MMKRMNTGVQSIELQFCNEQEEYCVRNDTHNVMPSEHYGKSGTLQRWEKEKNTTSSLFHQRLSLQQVLRVLVVLWLLLPIPNPFLCYAEAFGIHIVTNITDCFPNIVVSPSQTTQYCDVENAEILGVSKFIRTGYFNSVLTFFPAWPLSVKGKYLISFVPNSEALSGDMKLVAVNSIPGKAYDQLSNRFPLKFMNIKETKAWFASTSAYYGLKTTVRTNFLNSSNIQNYLLVPPQSDCDAMAKKCSAATGCYNLAISAPFPIPGNYSVCLTASGWRGHYLPWGAIPLEVRVLVPSELYVNALGKNTLLLQDAVTGANGADMNSVFLVKCPESGCSRVKLNSGDLIVSVDVCNGTAVTDRVYFSADGTLNSTTAGDYAACADYGAEVGIPPAALPVRVLQDPFAFSVTVKANTSVTINVRGGDLSWRKESYEVCALPPDTRCESVATVGKFLCQSSLFPNSPSVNFDISSLQSKYKLGPDNVTFCFVASNVTFNGRRYVLSHDVRKPFFPEVDSTAPVPEGDSAVVPSSNKLSVGAIVGIVIAVVVVLVIVAVILFFVLRRRQQQEQQRKEKVRKDAMESQYTSKTVAKKNTRNPLKSATRAGSSTYSAGSRYSFGSVQRDNNAQNTDDTVSSVLSWGDAGRSEGQMRDSPVPFYDTYSAHI